MRYAIISKGLTIDEIKVQATRVGATNMTEAKIINQVFCDLTEIQAANLSVVQGLSVKQVKSVSPHAIMMPERVTTTPQQETTDAIQSVFSGIRYLFSPPITGVGLTVVVVDSGIRKTHESLKDKVVYEANFSGSPTLGDVFGHGTQVAFIIAGGEVDSEKAGVAPGASIMNLKVINDAGLATEEQVVLAIERVCELVELARGQGLDKTDPMWPNVINLSLGAEDDGDKDSPMRAACREASLNHELDIIAAAGNYGPDLTTVTTPGTEPVVITVGAIETSSAIAIWEKSSRGPTKLGDMKPDFVLWGVDIEAASNENDTDFIAKSGTSFAAPMLSGLTGLLWESGRRVYGEAWPFRWTEARQLAPYYCMKSEDAPVMHDHDYGFGLPAVGTMVNRISSPRAGTGTDISGVMTPMMLMMMIMSMMKMMV